MTKASRILSIDPGPERSAYVCLNEKGEVQFGHIWENKDLVGTGRGLEGINDLVIESVESYGMPVGKDVFETCYWIGRFWQWWLARDEWDNRVTLLPRREIKLHLCGSARAKDSNIRQALIDRFGGERAIGGKKCQKCKGKGWFGAGRPECPECHGAEWNIPPGPLYGFGSHLWSALAVAVTYYDQKEGG